jgi:gliding motility-associated lipoprotein GldH
MKFVGSFLLLLILIGCGDNSIVNQSYEFDNETWQKKNRPQFSVDIKDTTKLYDFVFIIRTNTSYAYSNMWLYLHSKAPKGKPSKEALQVKIADESGRWIGNKTGSTVEHYVKFSNRKMPFAGKYSFNLELATLEKELSNVLDVSFTVRESELITKSKK